MKEEVLGPKVRGTGGGGGTQRCVGAVWAQGGSEGAGRAPGWAAPPGPERSCHSPLLNAPSVWRPHFHLIAGMNRANYWPGRLATREGGCAVRGLRYPPHPNVLV